MSAEMKAVWNVQLNILAKLIEVCRKYDLKMFLSGGSLIGAVRHQGYVPWDDDIDVDMLREDYDRLVEVAPKEFGAPFFFQCPYTEKGYYRPHVQIRYDGTTSILKDELYYMPKFHQGIFIDIFPLDNIPDDAAKFDKECWKRCHIIEYLWQRHYRKRRKNLKSFLRLAKKMKFRAFWSDKRLFGYFEDLLRSYSKGADSEYAAPLSLLPFEKREYWKREWFSDVVWMPFEKLTVPVPAGYHQRLTQSFGDYMTPVREPSLHGEVILDTQKDWREVQERIEQVR